MATTSLSRGPHWEACIRAQVESGRYASVSEVMREALRLQEAREAKLEKLRAHLKEGYDQAKRDEFVENPDEAIDALIEKYRPKS